MTTPMFFFVFHIDDAEIGVAQRPRVAGIQPSGTPCG
jgi:hypothetical protein